MADLPINLNMPDLEDDSDAFSSDGIFNGAYDDENVGAVADFNNMDDTINVSPIPTLRIHKNHLKDQILGDPKSAVQTRGKIQKASSHNKHWYMIGSLMYLTASRPDIMFVVCACARFQVTPKASHLNAVKRIFRYLKHLPKLGLWYPRDSPFGLEACSDNDYGGASLDRKSTIGGCQFLGRRLISWQCKKQTIAANSTTEAEYVAAANCCGQVLWIQNQMMDYGFNFMNTKIHIDNESTICIVKNPVYHSRTKHIEIRHHFIRDCYEKILIDVVKIHTDNNVADLLTKGFDVTRFNWQMQQNFTSQWKFLIYTIQHCLSPKYGGWDQFGSPIGTALIRDYVPLLPAMLAGAAEDQGEGSTIPAEPQHTPTDLGPTFTHVADEATTTGVRVGTEGATTTTSGLDAGLDSGNIHESPLRSYEAPLHEGHTSGSAEDSLQLKELMVLTTYGKAVLTLVERLKSLEVALKRKRKKVVVSDSEDEEIENQGRKIQDIDDDPLVSLVRESMKEKDTDFVTPTKISASREKAKSTDKGIIYKRKTRSKSIEKDISTDLHAGIEVNHGSEDFNTGNEDFNTGSLGVSTSSGPDTIRAKREANAELTKSLQGESMTSEDFAKRMVEMINQKKKFYAEQKAKARRSKPMTQAQQRDYMSTFIKNQSSWKLTQLKKLTFDELKTEFEKLVKSIENFVPMETDERVKRQGVQLEQEFSKKQKTIEEVSVLEESITEPVIAKEEEIEKSVKKRGKIRKQKARKGIHIDKTAQDESEEEREAFMKDKVTSASSESEIGIDAIPTATKPPSIVDWKIIPQSGLKAVYQIIRRDGSDKIYMSFGAILKDFSRDDLTELYRLVIKKYGANRPEEMYDRVLWGDLKTMFDPPLSDDAIWSLPLQQKMINWRYYPSCAVHCLTLDASTIYMLADRKYPLSKDACQVMLKMKLLDGTMEIFRWRLYEACGVCILELKMGTVFPMLLKKVSSLYGIVARMLDLGLVVRGKLICTTFDIKKLIVKKLKRLQVLKTSQILFLVDIFTKIVWFSSHLASQLRGG
ncbi:hypothetical protein Tco_0053873 [Tanacetum coccineum]